MRVKSVTTRAHMLMRGLTAAVLAGITLAWGCADFESTVDPTGGLPDVEVANPSFANDIQPIFTRRCAIGGCHSVNSARAEMVPVARTPSMMASSRSSISIGESSGTL